MLATFLSKHLFLLTTNNAHLHVHRIIITLLAILDTTGESLNFVHTICPMRKYVIMYLCRIPRKLPKMPKPTSWERTLEMAEKADRRQAALKPVQLPTLPVKGVLERYKDRSITIYLLYWDTTDRRYIGRTDNLERRIFAHINYCQNALLAQAIKDYGPFKVEVLECCAPGIDFREREQYWIDKMASMSHHSGGLNCALPIKLRRENLRIPCNVQLCLL